MTLVLFIDIIGVMIGIISITTMFGLKKNLGGRIGATLNLVMGGVLFNILAFGWTIVFTRLKLFIPPSIDVHHFLMTIGMILFVLAARKFSLLSQP